MRRPTPAFIVEHNTLLAPAVDLAPERASDVADFIILALEALGVDYVFGVPGGAIEPVYNALARSGRRGGPKAVVARNEQGAA